MTVVVL